MSNTNWTQFFLNNPRNICTLVNHTQEEYKDRRENTGELEWKRHQLKALETHLPGVFSFPSKSRLSV